MYKRDLSDTLSDFAKTYPVISVIGPHQTGKTTLVRSLFSDLPYISLASINVKLQVEAALQGFLEKYPNGAIIDDVHDLPELLLYFQKAAGSLKMPGRYVLIGLYDGITLSNKSILQSPTEGFVRVTMLPLSLSELNYQENIYEYIFKGGYPDVHNHVVHSSLFYSNYLEAYIERDLRQLKNIDNLETFKMFLKLCAGRIGQVLNSSALAQDCGISHTTARKWLSLLQASYFIFLLPPYHKDFNKRLVKMPKLYFYDTGIACLLLGLEKCEQLETHYLRAALFENMILLELLKGRLNKGLSPTLYFWRDHSGHEIDCITEWENNVRAIDIKLTSMLKPDFFKNLNYFLSLSREAKSYFVYNGIVDGYFLGIELISPNTINKMF